MADISMTPIPDLMRGGNPLDYIRTRLLRRVVVSNITKSLTGSIQDLRELSTLMKTDVGTPGLQSFLTGLLQDIEHNQGMARLFTRIGSVVNPTAKRKVVENLIFNWAYLGQRARKKHLTYERWIPSFLVISPSMRCKMPLFMADFWNDGPAAAGCLAGGRSYFHILNSGRIEPCVFAHFGSDNIRNTTILDAVNSPFFRGIRDCFPYNANGNLKRPCMIIDNPQVLREMVDKHLVPEGHAHSEDLIHDPDVVSWIDSYAESFRKIADPLWEELISNPENRWYRKGDEYRNLFRFQEYAALHSKLNPAPPKEQ